MPGLGTRAVDRVADDYPVLITPGQPNLRANATADEVIKYSPKRIDVINLETNAFDTVEVSELLRSDGAKSRSAIWSLVNRDQVEPLIGPLPDFATQDVVFTFDGLIEKTAIYCLRPGVADVVAGQAGNAS